MLRGSRGLLHRDAMGVRRVGAFRAVGVGGVACECGV